MYASTDEGRAEVATVHTVIDEALATAGLTRDDVATVAACLAGVDWPEDRAMWCDALADGSPDLLLVVENDGFATLRAGSDGDEAVAIACGTYAATAAVGRGGRRWHSGFWIPALGGRGIGKRALQAVVRAHLGIDDATALTEALLLATGRASVEALLKAVTARGGTGAPPDRADWVRPVFDAAHAGDPAAQAIVAEEARDLASFACAAARQVGIEPGSDRTHDLVVAGGVFRHERSGLLDAIHARYADLFPNVRVVRPRGEPVLGAVALALDAVRVPVTASTWKALLATGPKAEFYVT